MNQQNMKAAAIENALNNRRTWINITRNSVFDCHLSPVVSVSNDFFYFVH